MFKTISAPVSVQWELTPACNLKCSHCYNFWRESEPARRQDIITRGYSPKNVVEQIIANKVFQVTLTGGEPLLVFERMLPFIARLRDGEVDININSNLVLLNQRHVSMMKEVGIRSVLTSLMSFEGAIHDSLSNSSGSFENTCNGIRMAVDSGLRVTVNMVVSRKNIGHVFETGRHVKRMGASGFCATKATRPSSCPDFRDFQLDPGQLSQMFRDLLRVRDELGLGIDSLEHYPACSFPDTDARTTLGGRSCSAGKTGCTIGHDGLVRPCSHASQTYGHISTGLREAWLAMGEWRNGSLIPDRCKDLCKEYPLRCGGGCRVEAGNCDGGTIAGHDPYCIGGSPPARQKRKQVAVNTSSTFIPAEKIRFRRENGGFFAYLNPKNCLVVDESIGAILMSKRRFTPEDLARTYGVSVEKIIPTLRLLLFKKLVSEGVRE